MKKMNKGAQVVVLVTAHKGNWRGVSINYLDYSSPDINGIRPCIQEVDGKLTDLRTGENVVFPKEDAYLWNIFSGTVFEYPDNKKILISRMFDKNRTFIALEEPEFQLHPTTMTVRKVRYHVEKKD